MRTAIHPASAHDLGTVASILADVRGAADSGVVLLRHAVSPATDLPTRPFQAGRTRGDWVGAPGTADAGVLLYLHARRFQFDEPPGVLAGRLSAATRLPVLLLRYRLAPAHPYPAALDDVLDAYQGLLDQGTRPGQIMLAGHSAGATLTLSALLALHQAGRPMPAGAVAISPITDFTFSGESLVSNADRDVVTMRELRQTRDAYLRGTDPATAPASPLAGVPGGLPPLLIACGDSEMLRDDATRFAEAAAAAGDGTAVELEIFQGMPHGFPLLALQAASTLLDRVAAFTARTLTDRPGVPGR
jgi:acetyl esterase/lipase